MPGRDKVLGYMRRFYPESQYGGFTDCDGTLRFFLRVNALLAPSDVVLDVGCGRGAQQDDPVPIRRGLRILKGKCARVIGLDVDEAARGNPNLDDFHLIQGPRWPLADASVDLCLCSSVVEHVEDPEQLFAESARVLRPGGYLCIRTPNALSYTGLLSRLIPGRCHAAVLEKVQPGRESRDVFPTFYRCNTRRRLRKMLTRYGFDHCVYGYEAEPGYLGFCSFCYFLGVLHQKLMPQVFKPTLFAFARKRADPGQQAQP